MMRQSLRNLSDHMPDLSGLPDMRRQLADMARYMPRRRAGASPGAMAAIAILAAGVGAGLMFLFDPRMGRRRRAIARDNLTSWARRSTEAMDGASRDVANRARGLVIEMRSRWHREPGEVDDTVPASQRTIEPRAGEQWRE